MDDPPFDLSKFDPSTLNLSHLHEGEQNRIKNRQFTSQELSLLLSGQNPWTQSGKPAPLPKQEQVERPRASFTDDDRDFPLPHESRSWKTGARRKVTVLRVDPDTLPKSESGSKPQSERPRSEPVVLSDSTPPEILEPTEAEVLSIMHDNDLLEYRSASGPSERRKSMFQFYKDQWRAQRAFEEHSKKVKAARNAVNAELAEQSGEPAEKSDVDKAVESIEQRRVQSPEEQSAIISEERTRENAQRDLSNEQAEIQREKNERKPSEYLDDAKGWEHIFESPEAREAAAKMWQQQQALKSVFSHPKDSIKQPRDRIAELLDQNAERRREEREERLLQLLEQQQNTAYIANQVFKEPSNSADSGGSNPSPPKPTKPEHSSPFWAVLGFLRKWTSLGGVFLLGATWTMIQIDEYALALILLVIGMFAFSVQIYDWNGIENHRKATRVLKSFAVVLISGSLVFFGAVIFKKKGVRPWSNLLAKEIAKENITSPSPSASLTSLHEYFDQEVNNGLRQTLTQNVKIKDRTVPVQIRLFLDFEDRAEWLAFYVPDISEADTFQVCMQLVSDYEKAIRLFVQEYQGKIELGPIGGRMTQVKDLRFTGYIRFYHETTLNQSELDLLTQKALKKGLSVEFRGTYYQLSRVPKIN